MELGRFFFNSQRDSNIFDNKRMSINGPKIANFLVHTVRFEIECQYFAPKIHPFRKYVYTIRAGLWLSARRYTRGIKGIHILVFAKGKITLSIMVYL